MQVTATLLTIVLAPDGPGSLWPMIALIGAAGVVMGIMQAVRRKPGTAFLSLLCGASLLGLCGALAWRDGVHVPGIIHIESSVPRAPLPPRRPEFLPESRRIVATVESLKARVDRLGPKFRKLRTKELYRRFQDDDAVWGFSEVRPSRREAERQALERLADRLRIEARDRFSRHTKLPIADIIDEHREDLDKVITELLNNLKDHDQVQIVTGEFGSPEAPEHRSVVRVYPEQIVRDIDAKVSEFIETKVTPRSRRAATTLFSTLALGVMVYLAFVFVDTTARGQFTSWTLRIAAVLAFAGICGALWYLVP